MLKNIIAKSRFLPDLMARDRRILNVFLPLVNLFLSWAAYDAFAKGSIGQGIGHTGMVIVFFAIMVGPQFWAIVEDSDLTLKKVLAMMMAFGLLTTATGWMIRFTT